MGLHFNCSWMEDRVNNIAMRPVNFVIDRLFGQDKDIAIDLRSSARIIYGINGSGKTTVLKLLNAVLTGKIYEIRNINFSELSLYLETGHVIRVTKKEREKERLKPRARNRELELALEERHPPFQVFVELLSATGRQQERFEIDRDIDLSERVPTHMIEHEITELRQVSRNQWVHGMTGEMLDLGDVVERYSDSLPWLRPSTSAVWYREIVNQISVKFIQTQRLLTMKTNTADVRSRNEIRYQNTVIDYAERLQRLIRDELTSLVSLSQELDSSYPRRLLGTPGPRLKDEALSDLLKQTEILRDKLKRVDLLTTAHDIDIRLEAIGEENRRAISLYLSDSIKKYRALEPFADKLILFLDIVNAKFFPRKSISIGSRSGFKIQLASGGDVHPQLLSSGEQHEVVLLFDLIFFSKPGTLVLIDEPEISLHIEWQKKFLSDVEAIGRTADLKFLLATHSPAIIGKRVDISQEI